jgi:hypothetical protein
LLPATWENCSSYHHEHYNFFTGKYDTFSNFPKVYPSSLLCHHLIPCDELSRAPSRKKKKAITYFNKSSRTTAQKIYIPPD